MTYYEQKQRDRQRMADWACWIALIGMVIAMLFAFAHGISKELDRQERIYYDKELGRSVYVDPGV